MYLPVYITQGHQQLSLHEPRPRPKWSGALHDQQRLSILRRRDLLGISTKLRKHRSNMRLLPAKRSASPSPAGCKEGQVQARCVTDIFLQYPDIH